MKKFLKIIMYIILIVILLGIILLSALYYYAFKRPFTGEGFNQKKWLEYNQLGNSDYICLRGPMVSNLENEYLNGSLNKDEILKLLGKPDYAINSSCINYYLGMCSGIMPLDYDKLYICFDEKGEFTKSYIEQS